MDNAHTNDGLKYVGPDKLIGVPARDLTAAEAAEYGRAGLLASGLYVKFKKAYVPKPSIKAQKGGTEEPAKE